jgi:hypothetical protein
MTAHDRSTKVEIAERRRGRPPPITQPGQSTSDEHRTRSRFRAFIPKVRARVRFFMPVEL